MSPDTPASTGGDEPSCPNCNAGFPLDAFGFHSKGAFLVQCRKLRADERPVSSAANGRVAPDEHPIIEEIARDAGTSEAHHDFMRAVIRHVERLNAALDKYQQDDVRYLRERSSREPGAGSRAWAMPIITVQMLADFGQEGFFERTEAGETPSGLPVVWSQAAVDFACTLRKYNDGRAPETRAELAEALSHEGEKDNRIADLLQTVRSYEAALRGEQGVQMADGTVWIGVPFVPDPPPKTTGEQG